MAYDFGECTYGVWRLTQDWLPTNLGNANQWVGNARRDGLQVTDVPTVGAVAVWNDAGIYDPQFGHCGLVTIVWGYADYQVREMNFVRWDAYDLRRANRAGLLGFILPPGVAAGAGSLTVGPIPPEAQSLEQAWQQLAEFWNYVVDAEVVGMINIGNAYNGIS